MKVVPNISSLNCTVIEFSECLVSLQALMFYKQFFSDFGKTIVNFRKCYMIGKSGNKLKKMIILHKVLIKSLITRFKDVFLF